jgi:hypothetical protein
LQDILLDTTSLGKRNLGGRSTSNHEAVTQPCGEGVALAILNGNNVEGTVVLLDVHDGTHSSTIVTAGEHHQGTNVELEDIRHLSSIERDLDTVVDLDIRIGVSDGASIVSDGNRDLVGSHIDLLNSAELVMGLLSVNAVQNETSLGVEHETESVVGLLQFNDIHEPRRVVVVSADLSVDLDATFHTDLHAFLVGQGILESVTEDNGDGQALTELVRSLGRAGGPDTTHLPEVPMGRRIEALQMLFRSTSHFELS